MKKKYVTPDIGFECFCLNTDISAGCAWLSNQAPGQCTVDMPWGDTLFASADCTMKPGNDSQVCYHVPTADQNVFGS